VPNILQKTSLWSMESGFFFPLREEAKKLDDDDED